MSEPTLTKKQGQYLAFIYAYTEINGAPPAERDFRVTPPTVHQMIKKLHASDLIARTPGAARTIKILIHPRDLPILSRQ